MLTHVRRYLVYILPVIQSIILLDLDLFGVWDVVNGIYLFLLVKVSQDIYWYWSKYESYKGKMWGIRLGFEREI